MTRTYTVLGMTCEHCARAVHEEVSEVPGVSQVNVDLESGRLTISGGSVSTESVAAAVTDAGYELAE
jgi:copper chaperone CopZ